MTDKIHPTDEQQSVLDQQQKAPVFFLDDEGKTTHVILPLEEARRLFEDYVRRELEIGFKQADQDQLVNWNPDQIKAKGKHLLKTDSDPGAS